MSEVEAVETEEEGVVILERKHMSATEEPYVLYTAGAEQQDDECDSTIQPLLQHKHQDSCDENHKTDTQTATDGSDQKTSVKQELEMAFRDQLGCSGSVRSLCSGVSRHECPICGELFDSHDDPCITLLNCKHTLCHHCTAGIMSRARDPSRLQCPLCRQTTPYPQWEIRRLQEESYSTSVYELRLTPVICPAPELQTGPASPLCCSTLERQLEANTHTGTCEGCIDSSCLLRGLRLMRLHFPCFSISVMLLLLLVGALILLLIFFT